MEILMHLNCEHCGKLLVVGFPLAEIMDEGTNIAHYCECGQFIRVRLCNHYGSNVEFANN